MLNHQPVMFYCSTFSFRETLVTWHGMSSIKSSVQLSCGDIPAVKLFQHPLLPTLLMHIAWSGWWWLEYENHRKTNTEHGDLLGFRLWYRYLVGGDWNMIGLFSHSVGNVIIPIDELIFFRGGGLNQQPVHVGWLCENPWSRNDNNSVLQS